MNASPPQFTPRWWQPPMINYAGWEMFLMRFAFAALIFLSLDWDTTEFHGQPHPNGLAHFVNLDWLWMHPPGVVARAATIAGFVLYTIGVAPALGLLPALFFALCIGTLSNSQGAINHSWQLVTMILLAQFVCYVWMQWREKGWKMRFLPDVMAHRVATHAAVVVIAASYLVSALVKWKESAGLWIWNAPALTIQLQKANYNDFYNTLIPPPAWLQQFTEFLLEHPWFTRLFFGAGLIIESAAFVVLINRRWAFVGGLSIIGLHLGISRVMNLNFDLHIAAVLIFLVNLPGSMWMVLDFPRVPRSGGTPGVRRA